MRKRVLVHDWRAAWILACVALPCATGCGPRPSDAPHGRGVLVIAIDALRADHLSASGYDRETTPVLEAEELATDLRRAGIEPWAWVIDASIAAANPESPYLRRRARNELVQIERVRRNTSRVAIVPLLTEEPVGISRRAAISADVSQHA